MSQQVLYTPEAERDLVAIVQHIARDNVSAAIRWLDDTEAVCGLLATQSDIGQRMQTRHFGEVRLHASGNYLLYYRPIAGGVEILRVLHGARQQDRLI